MLAFLVLVEVHLIWLYLACPSQWAYAKCCQVLIMELSNSDRSSGFC
jgi:hypothetical protein